MYLEHFGFKRHPFRMAPEKDFLYMSRQHSRAFVFMDSAVWSPDSFVVISGEIGSGKTTLLKKMISNLKDSVQVFHISYTNLEGNDLFHLIMKQANIHLPDSHKAKILLALHEHLIEMSEKGFPVLLAIDEAQNLSHDNLEDIRMLAGMEGPNGPILKVILLGQPELKDHIYDNPQLTQRIKLFCHLGGLSEEDTKQYIHHRLNRAGFNKSELFPDHIISKMYHESSGIPRLLNKIADGLLLCAYAEGRHYLQSKDIDELRDELLFAKDMRKTSIDKPVNNSDLLEALNRIASSLEKIESKWVSENDDKTAEVNLFDHTKNKINRL